MTTPNEVAHDERHINDIGRCGCMCPACEVIVEPDGSFNDKCKCPLCSCQGEE